MLIKNPNKKGLVWLVCVHWDSKVKLNWCSINAQCSQVVFQNNDQMHLIHLKAIQQAFGSITWFFKTTINGLLPTLKTVVVI